MGEEVETKPAHYRLSSATWEIIVDEYRRGATVPELSLKWRVSQHALRRRITRHGATKRDWGDKLARQEAEAREAHMAERRAQERARVEALFCEADTDEAISAEASSLIAMRASHRAMRQQMWDEAKALAHLAEAYSRIASRHDRSAQRGTVSIDDIPLELVKAIALDENGCTAERLSIYGEKDPPQAKVDYWKIQADQAEYARNYMIARLQERVERDQKIEALTQELEQLRAREKT